MKVKVQSPGSATIINAISTGCGAAFGIELYVNADVELAGGEGITCISDQEVDTTLMEICARNVLERFKVDTGVEIYTTSTLPVASGLSSSSATSNAVITALTHVIAEEFSVKPDSVGLDDPGILNLAVDSSLEAGVTVTGAFDDASASYYGGVSITDNFKREVIRSRKWDRQNILIYMPNRNSPTADADVARMKLLAPWVKLAFKEAVEGNINQALTLNGFLYCSALRFDPGIALDALEAGADAAGLSGTGPSFVAITNSKTIDAVEDVWKSYPGRVIKTTVDNQGTQVIARE